tara:strand:- start:2831 stop:3751 length:921 start_codon:yes stop_codon:yes gene_type:complete
MSKKIVFMGTPEFAVPTLHELVNSDHNIIAVYSQPASKANRGQKLVESKIEFEAKRLSLNVRTPLSLDTDAEYNFLKSIKPDLIVVVAYGKIIPKRFLSIPKYGFINIHASLLPKWRGAAPIQRSLMNLDKETGISIMKIVEELDSGPLILQERVKINENIDSLILSKLLSRLGAKSIGRAINKIITEGADFKEQNHKEATYAKKISKNEAEINWNETAKRILAKINGLNPNPGAWFKYNNERYKVWKAKIVRKNGTIGKTIDDKFTVACREDSLKILEIQKEGKSRQEIEDFLNGNRVKRDQTIS